MSGEKAQKSKAGFCPDYAIHPGELLQDNMDIMDWSVEDMMRESGLSRWEITGLLAGELSVDALSSHGLGTAFRQSSEFWLNFQRIYDERSKKLSGDGFLDGDGI